MSHLTQLEVPYSYQPRIYIYKKATRWSWKYKLPDGSWFYCPAGTNEAAARRNARLKEADLLRGLFTEKEVEKIQVGGNSEMSFVEAADRYCANVALDASPHYIRSLSVDLKQAAEVIKKTFGVEIISKFKESHAFQYRDNLMNLVTRGEITRVTARNRLNSLKRMFKWLKKRKRLTVNPWAEIDSVKLSREDQVRTVSLPQDIYKRVLETEYKHRFGFPIKEFIRLLFETGVRQGEALHLEVTDVNWDTGLWSIGPKNCPTAYSGRWLPKYGKRRDVYIPKDLRDLLTPLVERAHQNMVVGYTKGVDGKPEVVEAKFIFTMLDVKLSSKRRKVYRRVNGIYAAWNSLFTAAGLGRQKEVQTLSTKKYRKGIKLKSLSPLTYTRHDLRRGYNEAIRRAGVGIADRCALLGHDESVNKRHYKGEAEVAMATMSAKLDEVFSGEEKFQEGA